MLLPFILSAVAILCAVVVLYQSVIAPMEYYRVLIGSTGGTGNTGGTGTVQQEEGYLPPIPFESQWATLNVEGWQRRDIPVFFGDSNAILRKGAGMWINSRFCGQNGKIVLSGHVTSDFYEIESTPIGAQITMDTVYGPYVYQVTETQVFHYQDGSLLYPADGEEVLILYTCYPRKNGHLFKTQRLALICKKVSGKEWKTYG